VRAVTAGYGGVPVLRDVSLEVGAGEMVALFGANGAGKTTTLRTIAGELAPERGEVELAGKPLRGAPHKRVRAGLGYLPEQACLVPHLTVAQNVALSGTDFDAVVAFAPEMERLRHRRAGLLSGGETRILAIGCALARSPQALVADELSLGLAPVVVERVLRDLRAAADRGLAVLLVEQHVSQALEVVERAYVLRRGQVALAGTAAELRAEGADALRDAYIS
jgi:branched-chain amino acid transport system ATP-binding protein